MSYPPQHTGLGIALIDDGGGDGGGGDIIGAIGAAIGAIASLFGGGYDDQATSYRPPANSATYFVHFDDNLGTEDIAYDATSPASLQIGINNGNRIEDIYSYYSVFVSGNVNSGASPAAARVVQDAARVNNVSLQRAADLVLKVVGIIRTVKSILTSPPPPAPRPSPAPYPAPSPYPQPLPLPPVYGTPPIASAPQITPAGVSSPWIWIVLIALGAYVIKKR